MLESQQSLFGIFRLGLRRTLPCNSQRHRQSREHCLAVTVGADFRFDSVVTLKDKRKNSEERLKLVQQPNRKPAIQNLASFCRETHDFFGSNSSTSKKIATFKGAPRDTGDDKQFRDRN